MANHAIGKVSHRGIGFSVVELNDVRHVYAAAVPRRTGSLREEVDDALETIEAVMYEEGTRGSIVHQAVFVADVSQVEECRQALAVVLGVQIGDVLLRAALCEVAYPDIYERLRRRCG